MEEARKVKRRGIKEVILNLKEASLLYNGEFPKEDSRKTDSICINLLRMLLSVKLFTALIKGELIQLRP